MSVWLDEEKISPIARLCEKKARKGLPDMAFARLCLPSQQAKTLMDRNHPCLEELQGGYVCATDGGRGFGGPPVLCGFRRWVGWFFLCHMEEILLRLMVGKRQARETSIRNENTCRFDDMAPVNFTGDLVGDRIGTEDVKMIQSGVCERVMNGIRGRLVFSTSSLFGWLFLFEEKLICDRCSPALNGESTY
jgi:hypothetical protein